MSRRERLLWRTLAGGALLLLGSSPVRAAEPLPDPTRPPVSSLQLATTPVKDSNEKLELRAIFHADDRRFAVINGRRVKTADRIAGAEVLAIEIDRVRLRRGEEIVELELVAPAFKNAREAGLSSASQTANGAKPAHLRGALR